MFDAAFLGQVPIAEPYGPGLGQWGSLFRAIRRAPPPASFFRALTPRPVPAPCPTGDVLDAFTGRCIPVAAPPPAVAPLPPFPWQKFYFDWLLGVWSNACQNNDPELAQFIAERPVSGLRQYGVTLLPSCTAKLPARMPPFPR